MPFGDDDGGDDSDGGDGGDDLDFCDDEYSEMVHN